MNPTPVLSLLRLHRFPRFARVIGKPLAGLARSCGLGQNVESMKYKVALKKSKEGYSVSCLGLPGCWSQGKTEKEALENIQDAIREYFEAAVKISKGAKVREVEVPV